MAQKSNFEIEIMYLMLAAGHCNYLANWNPGILIETNDDRVTKTNIGNMTHFQKV